MTLKSNLDQRNGSDVAYDQQMITFECTIAIHGINPPYIVSWQSENYIRTGGNILQIVSTDGVGHRVNSMENPTTTATLVSIDNSRIVSELNLTASSQLPTSAVSCRLNSHGTPETISFSKEDISS